MDAGAGGPFDVRNVSSKSNSNEVETITGVAGHSLVLPWTLPGLLDWPPTLCPAQPEDPDLFL